MKIGVFDSGIGGMTVLKELIKSFPEEEFIYFGDTANVPYGAKNPKVIRELCNQACKTLIGKKLDCIVVACNTASAIALDVFKNNFTDIPVFGVVEPGIKAVVDEFHTLDYNKDRRILILGTKATIKSQIYSREVRKHILFNQISEVACPLLVPLIEEGWADHPVTLEVIQEYIRPFTNDPVGGIALLACTHYPWVSHVFQKALPKWTIVNSAKSVVQYILKANIETHSAKKFKIEWIFTDVESVAPMVLNDFRKNLGIVIDL